MFYFSQAYIIIKEKLLASWVLILRQYINFNFLVYEGTQDVRFSAAYILYLFFYVHGLHYSVSHGDTYKEDYLLGTDIL
jgi:hypothetical protein